MTLSESTLANGISSQKRVIVVGAGWAGLVAAKTYLEMDPMIDLTIIDAERTLGGVWNQDRIYPGFYADSPVGLFDYSDLPMRNVIGLKNWSDLPGQKVHDYLKAYAEKFELVSRMRLATRVASVTRRQDEKEGWQLVVEGGVNEKIVCDKLILATGLASKPNWPDVPRDDFKGLVLHSKDVGIQYENLTSSKVSRVSVYGGCKSAIDTINLCILAGKHVDWVIRDTGNGPGMMVEARKKGYHGAIFTGRWKNILTPSIFAINSFWYRFLHSGKSKLGSWLCRRMWAKASSTPLTMEPYKTKSSNIEKLYPETRNALFFTASVAALHGNEEFVKQLHSGKLITVHRASIISMSGPNIKLSNGEILPSDAVVFATGWDYKPDIFDPADAIDLGISAPLKYQDTTTESYWSNIQSQAEKDVLETFPMLKTPPPHFERPVDHTPTRLYRYILPSSLAASQDHSLILLGLVTSIQTSISAEISALWGVAWMEGLLEQIKPLPSKGEMDYQISKINAWSARRYLSRGRQRQVASAEIQDVCDMWMQDLGLKVHRKRGLLGIRDTFVPYRSQDYKGIVVEVMEKTREIKVGSD